MGPIWGRQDPVGPYVGPMNIAIWDVVQQWHMQGIYQIINSHIPCLHRQAMESLCVYFEVKYYYIKQFDCMKSAQSNSLRQRAILPKALIQKSDGYSQTSSDYICLQMAVVWHNSGWGSTEHKTSQIIWSGARNALKSPLLGHLTVAIGWTPGHQHPPGRRLGCITMLVKMITKKLIQFSW